ncbi:MAG: signal peptide peptidase SppA [Rhodospirillaceae bacterium]|jgi:protease-4|nr:signal peptide peptidase SppA [Rhodospirillaceae bacterium]|tara:strand:- start:655 stop:1566 length:912 start_codon:yes stop_codon:yes gene_type:complete
MSLDADYVVERRRLKRRLTFWRVLGVVAVVAALVAVAGRFDLRRQQDHVAKIVIGGLILDDPARDEALKEVADDDKAKALMVKIDSPGGTYVGGEALFESLLQVGEKKPVVAIMGTTATSAGYMTALGSDHIVARSSTLTGSIGVILQTADLTGLLDKIGIKPVVVKSGSLKAQPNPLEKFSPAARKATEAIIADYFDMFVTLVAERRSLSKEQVLKLADGRIFSGRQAKKVGLIDALGAEPEARKWLSETHKIADSLPVEEVKVKHEDQPWRDFFDSMIGKVMFSERLSLDGVIALWHPDLW